MAKTKQSYRNDEIVWHINRWFEDHKELTTENYAMLTDMVRYKRREGKK